METTYQKMLESYEQAVNAAVCRKEYLKGELKAAAETRYESAEAGKRYHLLEERIDLLTEECSELKAMLRCITPYARQEVVRT